MLPEASSLLIASCLDFVGALSESLIVLLDLRASQIDGCLLCVQNQLYRARNACVPIGKVERIDGWRGDGIFSPLERAAFLWAEQLAGLWRQPVPDVVWSALKDHFSDIQIAALFMYWHCSELWSGDDVLRCCPAR